MFKTGHIYWLFSLSVQTDFAKIIIKLHSVIFYIGGVETESRQQTRRSPASFTDHSKFSKSAVDQPPYCTDESYYTKRDYEIFVNDHHREPVRGGRPKFSNSTRGDFGRGGLPRSNVEPFTFFRKRPDLEESTKTSKAFAGQQRPYYEQVKKDVVKLEKTTMMAEVLSSRENEPALQGIVTSFSGSLTYLIGCNQFFGKTGEKKFEKYYFSFLCTS